VKALSWKVQTRLHKRGWHLLCRGVMKPKVLVALAREMAGFVWAMLHLAAKPTPLPAAPVLRRA
jgi:transposase